MRRKILQDRRALPGQLALQVRPVQLDLPARLDQPVTPALQVRLVQQACRVSLAQQVTLVQPVRQDPLVRPGLQARRALTLQLPDQLARPVALVRSATRAQPAPHQMCLDQQDRLAHRGQQGLEDLLVQLVRKVTLVRLGSKV